MPFWLLVVGSLMLVSLAEIFLALRMRISPQARALIIAAAVATPLAMLAIFHFVMPEAGAMPIF
jgi:hypothetical protein